MRYEEKNDLCNRTDNSKGAAKITVDEKRSILID